MKLPTVRVSDPNGVIYHDDFLNIDFGLIPTGGNATAHAPALIETKDGGMLCAWFAGSFEGSGDISIAVAKLDPNTQTWQTPTIVSKGVNRSEQNPAFFRAPDGQIWLIYTSQLARQEGKDNMQFTSIIMVQKSRDEGQTWDEPTVLFPEEGTFSRQAIQVLSNGRVHANVVELGDGELVAFMRSRFADHIYISRSYDYGDSWTVPEKSVLPNNNASISAIRLQSGEIALAYNLNAATNPEFGKVAWPGLRNPVAVSISEDGGRTWPVGRIFESAEGFIGIENKTNNAQYEYPTLYQSQDGLLHLVYAYKNRLCVKYVRFAVSDVFGAKRESEGVYNPTSGQV